MKALTWALGTIVVGLAVVVAACSGNAGGPSAVSTVSNLPMKTGHLKTALVVPPKARQHAIDRMVAGVLRSRHVKPKYLPSATTEVDFTLLTINGQPAPDTSFNFSINTSGCTPGSGGYVCSATNTAPAAVDVYAIQACSGIVYGAAGGCATGVGAVVLSESRVTVTVPAGGTASASFSLNPVVGGFSWSTAGGAPWPNGTAAPTFANTTPSPTYTCGAGSCYDPLLNGAPNALFSPLPSTPLSDSLALNVLDANGNTIIPASGGGTVHGYPVFLNGATGGADVISVSCTDGHVQWLSGAASANPDPSPVPVGDKANGFSTASNTGFNSPVTGHDGASGADYTGAAVSVIGNTGGLINFDGGSATYTDQSLVTCTAQDTASTTPAKFYLGLGTGFVTWGGDLRSRHPIHHK